MALDEAGWVFEKEGKKEINCHCSMVFWTAKAYDPKNDPHDIRKFYAPPFALCHSCFLREYVLEFNEEPVRFVCLLCYADFNAMKIAVVRITRKCKAGRSSNIRHASPIGKRERTNHPNHSNFHAATTRRRSGIGGRNQQRNKRVLHDHAKEKASGEFQDGRSGGAEESRCGDCGWFGGTLKTERFFFLLLMMDDSGRGSTSKGGKIAYP